MLKRPVSKSSLTFFFRATDDNLSASFRDFSAALPLPRAVGFKTGALLLALTGRPGDLLRDRNPLPFGLESAQAPVCAKDKIRHPLVSPRKILSVTVL